MWYIVAFLAFGFLAGFLSRSWWAITIVPALVVLLTLVMTAVATDISLYGERTGPIITALLFAFWPFIGAVVGVGASKMIRARAH